MYHAELVPARQLSNEADVEIKADDSLHDFDRLPARASIWIAHPTLGWSSGVLATKLVRYIIDFS